jgi:hypothetical protein
LLGAYDLTFNLFSTPTMHFENLFFILLVAVVALLRWFSQKTEDGSKNSPPPPAPQRPIQRGEAQSEEERVRRFMEALGQPTTSRPPPKVKPKRSFLPEGRPVNPWLPPLTTAPPPLPAPPPVLVPSAASRWVQPRILKPAMGQAPAFEVRDTGVQLEGPAPLDRATTSIDRRGLAARLATSQGLRDAIVLREIFGPPRSLQIVEAHSGF